MAQTVEVTDLLSAAARGDQRAWDQLVTRYMPLVLSVVRRFGLSEKDAEDVSQTVWLRLVEHLDSIREPKALPGWITTTTRNESLALIKVKQRAEPVDPMAGWLLDLDQNAPDVDNALLKAEWQQALRDGLAALDPGQRNLLLLLVAEPPLSYEEIGRTLDMPIGSIGPTRIRCLKKLRATSPVQDFLGVGVIPVQRNGVKS